MLADNTSSVDWLQLQRECATAAPAMFASYCRLAQERGTPSSPDLPRSVFRFRAALMLDAYPLLGWLLQRHQLGAGSWRATWRGVDEHGKSE